MQDTGFAGHPSAGPGLLTFRTVDEAAAAVRSVVANYAEHVEAARAIVETTFDSDKVLSGFLDEVMERRS